METRAHHILIGLFTLVVFALALGFILWLSNHGRDRAITEYDVIFHETVNGLSKGGPVQYNGIGIGEIARLQLDPTDPRRVIARIRVTGRSPLRADTTAQMGFAGITGVGFIQLSGGTPDAAPLEPHGDQDVAQIDASPSDLARLQASGTDILMAVNEAVGRINTVLSPENIDHLAGLLRNTDLVVGAVSAQREQMGSLVGQFSSSSKRFDAALASVDQAARSITTLVDRDARPVITDAGRSLASVEQALRGLNQALVSVDGLLSDGRATLGSFNEQGTRQIGPTLDELRTTLGSLQRLSDQLSRSDSALLGNPQPKEFQAR